MSSISVRGSWSREPRSYRVLSQDTRLRMVPRWVLGFQDNQFEFLRGAQIDVSRPGLSSSLSIAPVPNERARVYQLPGSPEAHPQGFFEKNPMQ